MLILLCTLDCFNYDFYKKLKKLFVYSHQQHYNSLQFSAYRSLYKRKLFFENFIKTYMINGTFCLT